jgi:hypothetical protein
VFRVPAGVDEIAVDACGAAGIELIPVPDAPLVVDGGPGGLGARVEPDRTLSPGTNVSVRLGGEGRTEGGVNGGGAGPITGGEAFVTDGAGGGGATDLRVGGDGLDDDGRPSCENSPRLPAPTPRPDQPHRSG